MSCTIRNNATESYYDLSNLIRAQSGGSDWLVRGFDYGHNFSINICAPVVSPVNKFEGLSDASHVSAYYLNGTDAVAIGGASTGLHFRGRKLILEYSGGSPCPHQSNFRRTTTLSFQCDREVFQRAAISFVSAPNDCSYFFDVRTAYACPTVQLQAAGPFAIFGVILLVAMLVYCIGGCVYQRIVLHARGLRQIPHFQAITNAITMFTVSIPSFCLSAYSKIFKRQIGSRQDTYARVADENALIDEADDRWSDNWPNDE